MAKDHGPSVKDDKQYEGLRKKGMSKERAARIANDPNSSSKGGKASGRASAAPPRARAAPRPRRRPPGARAARPQPRRADAVSGSVFFVAIVAVGVVVATATGTIFLLVPFVAIALAAVLVPIVFGALRGTRLEPGASDSHGGVPSTSEASYEPVQQPRRP